jgi:hypothetical protein
MLLICSATRCGRAGDGVLRPEHIATQQNRNKVMMLLAFGWGQDRIARAMGIDPKTLRKNYSRELKFREPRPARCLRSAAFSSPQK